MLEHTAADPIFQQYSPQPTVVDPVSAINLDEAFGRLKTLKSTGIDAAATASMNRNDLGFDKRVTLFQEYVYIACSALKEYYMRLSIDPSSQAVLLGELDKALRSVAPFGDCFPPINKFFFGGMYIEDVAKRVEVLIPTLFDMMKVSKYFVVPHKLAVRDVKSFWNSTSPKIDATVPMFKQSGMPFPSSGADFEKNVKCYLLHKRLGFLYTKSLIKERDLHSTLSYPVISKRWSYNFGKMTQYPADYMARSQAVRTNMSLKALSVVEA